MGQKMYAEAKKGTFLKLSSPVYNKYINHKELCQDKNPPSSIVTGREQEFSNTPNHKNNRTLKLTFN